MTSNDRSAWAQIVLNIHEGHGLGTTNLPLVIVANLNKNRLESDVIHPFSTKLEVEFVWEGEMKEVKRLKQANTSIKVECFSVLNTQKREKMGYVVLSLRQAVLIPRDKKNSIVESWHKLMGVKPEMKKSEPKLLLTLSLQEKPEQTEIKNIIADTPVEKEGKEEISSLIAEKNTIEAPAPKSDNPTSSLQAEVIMETNRNVKMDKEEVKYGPITGRDDNCNRNINHYSLRISFEYVKFTTPPAVERIYIRVNHKSAEVLCTGCDEIDVSNISDVAAELRLKSSADQIDSLLSDSPQVQLYDATGVVASAILDLGDVSIKTEPKSHESDLICHKTKQKIGVLAARLSLRDCGVLLQQARYENDTETQPMKNMTFDRSVAERIVEELEDWKERQQQLFLVELKKKESDHLARLTAESIKRRKEMEDNLYENVNKYEAMAAALNEANEKIKEVALQNEDKARQLKLEEDDLHRKFNSKLQELREASKRMEADVNHKLNMASTERNELVDKLNHLLKAEKRSEKMKSALEEEIENLRERTVPKEEFEKVTQTLKNVEVSLNSALESKAFYKSQWGKAVREIHRLKKELQDAMDQQLQRERLEVFKIKLSQQAKEQEKDLVTDRLVLTNLQKETQDFIMKKCSTYS